MLNWNRQNSLIQDEDICIMEDLHFLFKTEETEYSLCQYLTAKLSLLVLQGHRRLSSTRNEVLENRISSLKEGIQN
jgi:hypothetical protein